MVLVKTQHTEVSFDLALKPSPQEPRRPRFSFCLQFSNSVASIKLRTGNRPANRPKPQRPKEAQKRRRSAAAPSRWAVYRRDPFLLSTRFLKVFRQKWVLSLFQGLRRKSQPLVRGERLSAAPFGCPSSGQAIDVTAG